MIEDDEPRSLIDILEIFNPSCRGDFTCAGKIWSGERRCQTWSVFTAEDIDTVIDKTEALERDLTTRDEMQRNEVLSRLRDIAKQALCDLNGCGHYRQVDTVARIWLKAIERSKEDQRGKAKVGAGNHDSGKVQQASEGRPITPPLASNVDPAVSPSAQRIILTPVSRLRGRLTAASISSEAPRFETAIGPSGPLGVFSFATPIVLPPSAAAEGASSSGRTAQGGKELLISDQLGVEQISANPSTNGKTAERIDSYRLEDGDYNNGEGTSHDDSEHDGASDKGGQDIKPVMRSSVATGSETMSPWTIQGDPVEYHRGVSTASSVTVEFSPPATLDRTQQETTGANAATATTSARQQRSAHVTDQTQHAEKTHRQTQDVAPATDAIGSGLDPDVERSDHQLWQSKLPNFRNESTRTLDRQSKSTSTENAPQRKTRRMWSSVKDLVKRRSARKASLG